MPTWTPAPRLPARIPDSAGTAFVGRLSHLAVLEDVWTAVCEEHRQAVFIGGEPGVGKTRLAAEAAVALHAQGAAVLWGTCHPDFELPYQPLVAALEQLLDDAEAGSLADLLPDSAPQLLRLTPRIRRHLPDRAAQADEHGPRVAVFDAVVELFVALAARHPVVVVLEDLHWAATTTLQLLAHLVQSTARAKLLIVATHRTTSPDRNDRLTHEIADLYRHDGVSRIDLQGLGTDEVADYLVREAGMPRSSALGSAAVLRDQTGGNPFFLRELWRDISSRGGVTALRAPGFSAPLSVRDMLDRRLAELADVHEDVIELAAVMGNVFELGVLLDASEQPRATALAAVDLGVSFGLLEPDPRTTTGRYRFLHALARQAVLDRMLPSRMVQHHARIAEVLERRGGGDPRVVGQLAHHFTRARALGHADRAITYLVMAAEHAQRSTAHEEAAACYGRAADLRMGAGRSRDDLLFAAADSHMRAGDFAEARRIYEQLATSRDPDVLLRAAIGYEDSAWRPGVLGERSLELLDAGLRQHGGSDPADPLRVRALASMGRAAAFVGDNRQARELGERALWQARELEDESLLAHALAATLWRGMTPKLAPQLLARAVELSELARRSGKDDHLGPAAFYRSVFGYMLGRPDEWATARDDLARAVRVGGQPFFRYVAGCGRYARQFSRGDLAGAAATVATLGELGAEFGPDTAEGSYGVQMFMLQRATGEIEKVRGLVTGEEDPEDHWAPGLLALYCALEMWAAAERVLAHLLDDLPRYRAVSPQWGGVLAFLVDAVVGLGDEQAAARLRPLALEHAGCNLIAGQFVAVFGSADRYVARLDSLLDLPSAEGHFEAALDMDRRMGSVLHQVETLTAWAQHAERRGDVPGRRRAGLLTAEARALAERIGHRRVLGSRGGGEQGPARAPDGLTDRELDVLRLVAEGLSNRAIGDRLFISQNTAANHVRSILMKTGASNRTRAAMYAAEHGLLDQRQR